MEMRRKLCPGRDVGCCFSGYSTRMQEKTKTHLQNEGQGQQLFSGAAVLLVCSRTILVFNSFVLLPGIHTFICSSTKTCADSAPGQIMLPWLKMLNRAAAPSHCGASPPLRYEPALFNLFLYCCVLI